jgi:hypothetical protein
LIAHLSCEARGKRERLEGAELGPAAPAAERAPAAPTAPKPTPGEDMACVHGEGPECLTCCAAYKHRKDNANTILAAPRNNKRAAAAVTVPCKVIVIDD